MVTIRIIYKPLFYQICMKTIAKLGAIAGFLLAGATATHATGLAEETIPYTPEPTSIESAQDNQEKYTLSPDTILHSFDYRSPIEIREMLGRDDEYRTFQFLANKTIRMVDHTNDSDNPYIYELCPTNGSWEYLVGPNSRELMNPLFNSTVTNELMEALIQSREDAAYQIAQNSELEEMNRNSLEQIALMETELKENEENTREDLYQYSLQIARLQKVIEGYFNNSQPQQDIEKDKSLISESQTETSSEKIGRDINPFFEPFNPIFIHQEQPTLDEQYPRTAPTLDEFKLNRHRTALTLDVLAGNNTIYGGLGVSINPSSSIPFGFTASALAGGVGDIVLEEITTEPSPYGIYGHGIREQQGKSLFGGALEVSFGGPSFYVSVGGELTYSSWIEKVTEEICKNGEVLVSNQNFTPNSEISGRIRAGLEFITKSGVGFGGLISIDPQTGEVSIGGRISYGK